MKLRLRSPYWSLTSENCIVSLLRLLIDLSCLIGHYYGPQFLETQVEFYAYDVSTPKLIKYVFYGLIIQETVCIKIIPPLIDQHLSEALENFERDGFKFA